MEWHNGIGIDKIDNTRYRSSIGPTQLYSALIEVWLDLVTIQMT